MEILIVDDHALFLDGMRHVLKTLDETIRIHTAQTAECARKHFTEANRYDLILLDMEIGPEDGVELLKQITAEGILTPVLIVSASENIARIQTALNHGALGFVPKACSGEKLLEAVRTVLAGDIYLERQMRLQLTRLSERQKVLVETLTRKQLKVLIHLQSGSSNSHIAEKMFLTENTVKSHLLIIYQKMGVKNRVECVLKAQKMNITCASSELFK